MPSAFRVAFVLLLTSISTGCFAPTKYLPGAGNGYSETQLQPDVVEVRFGGNSRTSMERASDFMMLRCAELALEEGYTHFAILGEDSDVKLSMHTSINTVGAKSTVSTSLSGKPRAMARIRLLKGPSGDAFDAAYLRDSIRAKYGL